MDLVKERSTLVPDLWDQSWFFFRRPEAYDDKVIKKVWREDTPDLVAGVLEILRTVQPYEAGRIEKAIREWVERQQAGLGKIMNPLRLALVGSNQGPGLMDTMELLGRDEALLRIRTALEALGS